jgi:TnpA family transposase
VRHADARLGLLCGSAWNAARPTICRSLGHSLSAEETVAALSRELDQTYRTVVANLPSNPGARVEQLDGKDDLIVTPLDKLDEPDSLVKLRAEVNARLPRVDLPEVLLEIAARTEFTSKFTHVSERESRMQDLPTSLCANLIGEACNIGLEPLTRNDVPALRRARLSWVSQNFIRNETLVDANACLVAEQNRIALVHQWGGGEVASADGLRFVVPVRTLHAGPNPKYFGFERCVTYYNLVSDQFTGLNAIVIPGTLRDSLYLLAVVLEQQTELHPIEIMTDTGAYTDVVFGLFWLLGYRFCPRIADIGGARYWRIDPSADYGSLNGIARHRINTKLILENWDDMLRLAGSLKLGMVQAASIMKTLRIDDRPTKLAQAVAELGRTDKTIHALTYIADENKRRRTLTQLNRGEDRHKLARAVFHGKRGELRQRYRGGPGGSVGRVGPGREHHYSVEHSLHQRCFGSACWRRLCHPAGGHRAAFPARFRTHQSTGALCLLGSRVGGEGSASTPSQSDRRPGGCSLMPARGICKTRVTLTRFSVPLIPNTHNPVPQTPDRTPAFHSGISTGMTLFPWRR